MTPNCPVSGCSVLVSDADITMVLTVEEQRRYYDLSLGLATESVSDDGASQHPEFEERGDLTHFEHPNYHPDEPRYIEPYVTENAQDWCHDLNYQRQQDLARARDLDYEDKFPAWDETSQVNSTQQPREEATPAAPSTVHLKSDGTPDRRFRENKNLPQSGPLRKDGMPDMRYRANPSTKVFVPTRMPAPPVASAGPLRKNGMPEMRYQANQNISSAPPPGPLKRDGTPDMRYQVNRSAGRQTSTPARTSAISSAPSAIRLKKDGTPDMRFSANRRK